MKKILLILIISLVTTHMCFSNKIVHENNLNNLKIEYNDVKLFGTSQYKPKRIVDKNDNTVFAFSGSTGKIVETDECIIVFDNTCILYFYEISFENIKEWYYYMTGGIVQKSLICKKVIVEIKR